MHDKAGNATPLNMNSRRNCSNFPTRVIVIQTFSIRVINMEEFCSLTSLHGWNFCIRKGKSAFHKIFWVLINTSAFIAAVVLVKGIYDQFVVTTISVGLETTTAPIDQIMFPTLSICNAKELRQSVIRDLVKEFGDVDKEKVTDVAVGLVSGVDVGLTDEEQNIRDRIATSNTLDKLFDEMAASFANATNFTLVTSNNEINIWHPEFVNTDYTPKSVVNKTDDLKLSLFAQLASQFAIGELVTSVNMANVGYLDVSNGIDKDFGETCKWVGGFSAYFE